MAPVSRGRALEGVVRDLTHAGEGVVITDAGAVLAQGALPGERVRLRLQRKRRGALRGRVLAVLDPSADRVEPPCALQRRCGGCPWMTLTLEAQHALKRARVARALEGLGAEPPAVERVASPHDLGYRTRARLAWSRSVDRVDGRARASARIGYRATSSREVVDVEHCVVLAPALSTALTALRAALAGVLVGDGEVELAPGLSGGATLRLRAAEAQPPQVYAACEALASRPGVDGVELAIEDLAPARWGTPGQLQGELRASAGAFAQANAALNRVLIERVVELAAPESARVLELYAGHGNFTVVLARSASSLTAVESDPAAADACRANLRRLGLAGRVVTGAAADHAAGPRVDVVVLDPPRSGARDALAGLCSRRPERVVYVSCDPATLARDLSQLAELGYLPDRALALDMFPHTGHVEAVVRLSRRRDQGS